MIILQHTCLSDSSYKLFLVQIAKTFWKAWYDFEACHGNEDTFREMLRIKRSVQAQFSTQVNFVSVQMLAAAAEQEASNKTGYYYCVSLYISTRSSLLTKSFLIEQSILLLMY